MNKQGRQPSLDVVRGCALSQAPARGIEPGIDPPQQRRRPIDQCFRLCLRTDAVHEQNTYRECFHQWQGRHRLGDHVVVSNLQVLRLHPQWNWLETQLNRRKFRMHRQIQFRAPEMRRTWVANTRVNVALEFRFRVPPHRTRLHPAGAFAGTEIQAPFQRCFAVSVPRTQRHQDLSVPPVRDANDPNCAHPPIAVYDMGIDIMNLDVGSHSPFPY
jgi:hypothetical protein